MSVCVSVCIMRSLGRQISWLFSFLEVGRAPSGCLARGLSQADFHKHLMSGQGVRPLEDKTSEVARCWRWGLLGSEHRGVVGLLPPAHRTVRSKPNISPWAHVGRKDCSQHRVLHFVLTQSTFFHVLLQ